MVSTQFVLGSARYLQVAEEDWPTQQKLMKKRNFGDRDNLLGRLVLSVIAFQNQAMRATLPSTNTKADAFVRTKSSDRLTRSTVLVAAFNRRRSKDLKPKAVRAENVAEQVANPKMNKERRANNDILTFILGKERSQQ